ncbi:TetR/AcrR family transcriptional regulator [Actinomadura rupiterrae]|uniref:TetR/AcrR family transcriptional regulator n=1 Tax=Actinomadura rupiterrae TaxID=559627 RepID=UPI0020A27DC3|nr:TetR/AcrR family transcriptional regulator [Actinomadura rupiterrae]MCP2338350.1 AcrR family transcriptional regulator [Actinomadura rupiterrae]
MTTARERLLDALAEIMRTRGLAEATTKEIARVAGCSEALLYKHFRDKEELMLCVLRERMPAFTHRLTPGEGGVRENLVATVHGGLRFYRKAFPMMAGMLTQPRVLEATRDSLRKYGAGPHEPIERVAEYLRAEIKLGRVRADANASSIAALLIGATFQQGFLLFFAAGTDGPDPAEEDAERLVRPLLPALLPNRPGTVA